MMACCRRERSQRWWGVFYLPTFWLSTVFGLGLAFNLWWDRRQQAIIDYLMEENRILKELLRMKMETR